MDPDPKGRLPLWFGRVVTACVSAVPHARSRLMVVESQVCFLVNTVCGRQQEPGHAFYLGGLLGPLLFLGTAGGL